VALVSVAGVAASITMMVKGRNQPPR
jgi:hypothetical protein